MALSCTVLFHNIALHYFEVLGTSQYLAPPSTQALITKLDSLTDRCEQGTELATFLINVRGSPCCPALLPCSAALLPCCPSAALLPNHLASLLHYCNTLQPPCPSAQVSGDFEFGLSKNWNRLDVLTIEDRLHGLE